MSTYWAKLELHESAFIQKYDKAKILDSHDQIVQLPTVSIFDVHWFRCTPHIH
jgi:hypothetical protein